VPSDIHSSVSHKKEFRLSFILAGGFFLILFLVAAAILIVTYQSSKLVVEQQRDHQRLHSETISRLVMKSQMDGLSHIIDLTSDDPNFRSLYRTRNKERLAAFLRSVFYAQAENRLGFIALMSAEGKMITDLHNELFSMNDIVGQVGKFHADQRAWFWVSQKNGGDEMTSVLVYYKREILDTFTGRVDGYLVGGFFLNDNQELVQEFQKQSQADFSALVWKGRVVALSGKKPDFLSEPEFRFAAEMNEQGEDGYLFFKKSLMSNQLQGIDLFVLNGFIAKDERALRQFYLISAGLVLLVTFLLSVLSALAARSLFLKPLKNLVLFARKVERQDNNPDLPLSPIADFNQVGRNLANVLNAFQESERRFQDFVSVSSDSVWETDTDGRYVFLSRDINSSNKIDLNQILGKRRWEVDGVDPDYGDWDTHRQTLADHQPFRNFIFRRIDPGGHMLYWSASGKPRYDKNGVFAGYRGASSNITVEIETQREANNIQDQLRQSQKLEVVGQLTGGVAHDFNNLLSVVLGNLELIEETNSLEGQLSKNLQDAIKGAKKGAALTHQLLAYSRQQTLNPVAVQPSTVIRDMYSLLERALGEIVNVRMKLDDSWPVLIDPTELENALLNLAVNARDAMPGGGELMIECFDTHLDREYTDTVPELKEGDYVCVVVNDAGDGIEEAIRDRILEPFFTTKEVGKGSGLGLSMVFGFVKQSGGHMTIYSEMGKGTSIQLYLPRAREKGKEEKTADKSRLMAGTNERVLVVEDNPQVRQLIVAQLKSIGYRAVECEDGATAITILESGDVDILLSDVTLPLGMNGVEIVNAAREYFPDMPTLLMSGFTGNAIRSKDDLPDGVEILYKPFTKIRLSEALHRAGHPGATADKSRRTDTD